MVSYILGKGCGIEAFFPRKQGKVGIRMDARLICDINDPNKFKWMIEGFEEIFAELQMQVWVKDISGRYLYTNEIMKIADGITDIDVIGKTDDEIYKDQAVIDIFTRLDEEVTITGERIISTYELPNGSFEEVVKMPIFNPFGEMVGILGYCKDVTAEKLIGEHSRRVAEAEKKFKAVYDNVPVGLMVYDAKASKPVMFNDKFAELVFYTREQIMNMRWNDYAYLGKGNEEIVQNVLKLLRGEISEFDFERQIVRGDESLAWFNIQVTRYLADDNTNHQLLVMIEDVTASKEIKAELERVSFTDELTGLYNRTWYIKQLKERIKGHKYPYSIIMGDANGLKICNDAFGHAEGDKLIAAAGAVFRKFANEYGDFAVRFGGDEFLGAFPGVDEEEISRIETAMHNDIRNMGTGFMDYSVALGAVTMHENDGLDFETAISVAEEKMYNNKIIESRDLGDKIVDRMIATLRRDPLEASHMNNVERFAERMTQVLGLNNMLAYEVVTAARLHDIGMVACNGMRSEPGKPILGDKNGDDTGLVRKHSEIGYRLLHASRTYGNLADYVLHHHENIDGSGYPSGLKGEEIPMQSRIIRIVDYYDALTNPRFGKNLEQKEVIEELRKREGILFDTGYTEMLINELILQGAL